MPFAYEKRRDRIRLVWRRFHDSIFLWMSDRREFNWQRNLLQYPLLNRHRCASGPYPAARRQIGLHLVVLRCMIAGGKCISSVPLPNACPLAGDPPLRVQHLYGNAHRAACSRRENGSWIASGERGYNILQLHIRRRTCVAARLGAVGSGMGVCTTASLAPQIRRMVSKTASPNRRAHPFL